MMGKYAFLRSLVTGATLLLMTLPAYAANEALMELLKALHENGTIDASTYDLVKRVAESEEQSGRMQAEQVTPVQTEKTVARLVDEKIDQIKTDMAKTKPKVRIGGRLQVDSATYNEDVNRHSDGTEIRRARLFAQGDLGTNWAYKLQYDFTATGLNGVQDAYLDYKGFDRFKIRLGHFKEPSGLQNGTSSKYNTFMERGLPHLFTEGRNLGIQASTNAKNWSLAAGVFGQGRDGAGGDNDEGWGMAARGTYAPILNDENVLHLGASISHRMTGSVDTLRFRERPESHVTDTRIVDTGTFDANDYTRIILESAYVQGPFSLQGEYYYTTVNRDIAGNPDLDFDGFYIEGGWFLTGESMNYKGSSGSFSRISPNSVVGSGGWGAWQVALRFSNVDLTDADINGGEADSFTVGLNWFATQDIRFTANYVNVLNVDGGPSPGDEPDVFQVRAQYEF